MWVMVVPMVSIGSGMPTMTTTQFGSENACLNARTGLMASINGLIASRQAPKFAYRVICVQW